METGACQLRTAGLHDEANVASDFRFDSVNCTGKSDACFCFVTFATCLTLDDENASTCFRAKIHLFVVQTFKPTKKFLLLDSDFSAVPKWPPKSIVS